MVMTRIAVIGAGIAGVTTAYALNERGYDVTIFDQQRYARMETSFANGGQLSASMRRSGTRHRRCGRECAGC
jgi:D-amino-acid dehydrogenase